MFKKLRLKLTLFNLGVFGGILVAFMFVVFIFGNHKNGDSVYLSRSILFTLVYLLLGFIGSLFISNRALIPIKKAWQEQIDFTANASHELRTPLAVIQTNIELVLDNPHETIESQEKWLNNILSENKRMSKLVNELLTLSRADSYVQTLSLSIFKLDEAITECTDFFDPSAKCKGLFINTKLKDNLQFLGDKDKIKQLVMILIDNSIKYSSHPGCIEVSLSECNKTAKIEISDNGDGIPEKDLKNIFKRFYRVDKARSRKTGGSGLGLSIAEWIVHEHKGTINVTSKLGKGTRFVIMLPMTNVSS